MNRLALAFAVCLIAIGAEMDLMCWAWGAYCK